MTGAWFRMLRDGKVQNIELEYLTDEERKELFTSRDNEFLIGCINILSKKVVECETLLDGLVEDGILEAKGEG